nr:hypothetical protein [Tanacetum cinerariifolium]
LEDPSQLWLRGYWESPLMSQRCRASEAVAPGQLRGAEVRRRAFLEIQIEECKLANCSISRKREPIPKSYLENDIFVTQPRPTHLIVTKSKSPIRRHITHSLSPKTSNSPPRVTAVQALVVSVAQDPSQLWLRGYWESPLMSQRCRASEAVAPGQLRGAEVRRRAFLEIQIEECKLANCSISRKREPIPKSYLENDIFVK